MKKSRRTIGVILSMGMLVSLAIIMIAGCSSAGGSASAMMEKMPWDTSQLTYVNVASLRDNAALDDLYDEWRDGTGQMLSAHGIDRNSVSSMAYGSEITIIAGSFDLAAVREELDDRDYDDDEYRGVEVWEKPYGNELVALKGSLVIMGPEDPVKECIRVMEGSEDSFADKQHAADVMNKLPGGLLVHVSMSNWLSGMLLGGFEALGMSAQKADEYTLRVTFVLKFDDQAYAEDAKNKVEDLVDTSYRNVEVRQDGQFIIATGEIDVEDASDAFGEW